MQTISSITIDGNKLELGRSMDNTIVVFFNGDEYHSLSDLIKASNLENNTVNLAKLICFAHGEDQFRFIEDIPRFKKEYNKKMQLQKSFEGAKNAQTNSPEFYDLSDMSPPAKLDGKLAFYAEKKSTGVPYCIRWNEANGKCSFELLKSA